MSESSESNLGVEFITLVDASIKVSPMFARRFTEGASLPDVDFDFDFADESFDGDEGTTLVQLVSVSTRFTNDDGTDIEDFDDRPFDVAVTMAGRFRMGRDASSERQAALRTTAAAIVFPYIREVVSSLTMRTVYPSLRMPPINVIALRQKAEDEARAED